MLWKLNASATVSLTSLLTVAEMCCDTRLTSKLIWTRTRSDTRTVRSDCCLSLCQQRFALFRSFIPWSRHNTCHLSFTFCKMSKTQFWYLCCLHAATKGNKKIGFMEDWNQEGIDVVHIFGTIISAGETRINESRPSNYSSALLSLPPWTQKRAHCCQCNT